MADADDEQMFDDAWDVPWDSLNDPWNADNGVPDFDALFGGARAWQATNAQPALAETPPSAPNPWQNWTPRHAGTQHSGVPGAASGGNYPVFTDGQHVWEKKEEADRPPEWDGNDPLNQLEVYLNSLKFWQRFTASKKKFRASWSLTR